MAIREFKGISPTIPASCFVEDSAQVIGDVQLGEESSVWFNSVVRGDVNRVRIGKRTNIQDLTMVHVQSMRFPTIIGDEVTVGHHSVLHGCTIGNRVMVGMGAVLMDGVEIGDDCIIGAGSLLTPGTKVPAGSLVLGGPAKVRRALTDEERQQLVESASNYVGYLKEHAASRKHA